MIFRVFNYIPCGEYPGIRTRSSSARSDFVPIQVRTRKMIPAVR
jgi:hypothetical protein